MSIKLRAALLTAAILTSTTAFATFSELDDDFELKAIAQKAVSPEAIFNEVPFDWSTKFSFKKGQEINQQEIDRANRLIVVVKEYFSKKLEEIFEKKRAFSNKDNEWHRLQDEYSMLINYRDNLFLDEFGPALSAAYEDLQREK